MPVRFDHPPDVVVLFDGDTRLLIGPAAVMLDVPAELRLHDPDRLLILLLRYADRPEEIAGLQRLAVRMGLWDLQLVALRDLLSGLARQAAGGGLVAAEVPAVAEVVLPGGAVSAASAEDPPVGPVAHWSLEDRIAGVVRRTLPKVGPALRAELMALLDPWAIGAMVAMIAVPAALIASGAGAKVGVALYGLFAVLAFAMLGWSAWRFLTAFTEFVTRIVSAETEDDLEAAADALARAAVAGGIGVIIVVLRRLPKSRTATSRHARKPDVEKQPSARGGGSAGQPATPASPPHGPNQTRRAPPPMGPAGPMRGMAGGGPHNMDWKPEAENFETPRLRDIDLDKLPAAEKRVAARMDKLGYPTGKVEEVIASGIDSRLDRLPAGTKLYGVSTQGRTKADNSLYWLDEAGYKDIEERFRQPDGRWDRHGVKMHLALPCYNRVNDLVVKELVQDTDVVRSRIAPAVENLAYRAGDSELKLDGFALPGGGQQVIPLAGWDKVADKALSAVRPTSGP